LVLTSLVLPAVEQWSIVTTKLGRKKTELDKINTLLKNETNILLEFEKIQKGVRLTDPQKRAEDTLLLQADEMQKEANVRYTRMDPVYTRRLAKMPGYRAFTLQVMFDADLLTVGKFLQGMQERGLYIDYFQLVPKAKAAHNPILQATIRMGKLVSKQGEK